ncbi:hypothetical protein GF420_12395, partial [candidate division GN15 bacterium]|nr:hypothetical protein [candidate division GN15 bacterium]
MAVLCLADTGITRSVERFEIDDHRDATYLPYELDTLQLTRLTPSAVYAAHSGTVARVSRGPDDSGLFVQVGNPPAYSDQTAQVGIHSYPDVNDLKADYGVRMDIHTFWSRYDSAGGATEVIGAGYRNDSVFAFSLGGKSTEPEELFLATGEDRTGNGRWSGEPKIVLAEDYDLDGSVELFVYVQAQRDIEPRLLICLETAPLGVAWSLPVASIVNRGSIYACADTLGPSIIFTAWAPGNGAIDTNFNDLQCYLCRVNTQGQIVWKKVIAHHLDQCGMSEGPAENSFAVYHTRPLNAPESDSTAYDHNLISLINSYGDPVTSGELPLPASSVWLSDYDRDGVPDVQALLGDGSIAVLDADLTMTARSNPTTLVGYVDALPGWGEESPALVFGSRSRTEVYSTDYRKLAIIHDEATIEPIEVYPDSSVWGVIAAGRAVVVAGILKRQWYDYVAIAYLDYQNYILTVLFGALVGLLLISYYGRKTRRNLAIIQSQKLELEQTHLALQEAQAKIITQEKFQQAKDIAGGFAHEIRNALFPARGVLQKVSQGNLPGDTKSLLKRADKSIRNAVDMTRQITDYTKLDSRVRPEPTPVVEAVREALEANEQ